MTSKYALILFIASLFVVGMTQGAFAQAAMTATAQPQPASDTKAAPEQPKAEKVPSFDWGFEQRIRTEDWNNITDYNGKADDERHQIRFRNRFWFNLPLASDVDLYVGMNNEFKKQTLPGVKLNGDELIFEALYVDFKKLPIKGLSLRVGRQNLMRGEGFVLFDGSSGDGSRTAYFNGIDLSYGYKKSKVELIGILDPRQDRMLPIVHDQHKYLNEWDEQAIGLYYTDRNSKNNDVDAYYFYKKEVHDYRAITNAQFQPDRHISTLGARLVHRFNPGLAATTEFAEQWGAQHPSTQIQAWGGYGYLKKSFPTTGWKPYILGGYWAMSGDDPSTSKIEGWDPIFSRWPKWSELYIYSQVRERGVAYETNDRFLQFEGGFNPVKKVGIRGTWYHHNAFHAFPGSAAVYGTGTGRGDNFQVRTDITLNNYVKGHLLYESLSPGNFYKNDGLGYFFRAEITYTFKGSIPLRNKQ